MSLPSTSIAVSFHTRIVVRVLMAILFLAAAPCLQAQTWDLDNDFSTTNNPNGAWSYGYEGSVGGPFNVFTAKWDNGTVWYLANWTGAPAISQGVGMWAYDNGMGLPVVRWTCPTAGLYKLSGSFWGDSRGTNNNLFVLVGGITELSATENAPGQNPQYLFPVLSLSQGETIDIVSEWNGQGSSQYNWAGAEATIVRLPTNSTGAGYGGVDIGQSLTATLIMAFSSGTTLKGITATTEGKAGLDYNVVTGGTCATKTAYAAGTSCTVDVAFTPQAVGERHGNLALTDSNGKIVAQTFLYGYGTGPAIAFNSGASSALAATGLSSPQGTAVDAAGDVFIADSANNRVVKLPAGGGTQTTVGTQLSQPSAVAVDGAGNLYIANSSAGTVDVVSASTGAQTALNHTFSAPAALAIDGSDNLYVASYGNNRVIKIAAGAGTQSTVGTGLSAPAGLAIDTAGNIYIADSGHNQVVEVPAAGGAQVKLGTGLSNPHGLAVDAAQNVYIADTGNNRVVMVPAVGNQTTLLSGLNQPYGLSLDGQGNLYVADSGKNRVLKVDRKDAPAINFATTLVNATSSDSPRIVGVQNVGTGALGFDSVAGVTLNDQVNFSLGTGTSDCAPGVSLNPGASCLIEASFSPSMAGTLPATVTLNDNTLNVAGSLQAIQMSGTGILVLPAPVLGSISPTSATAGSNAVTLTLTGSNFVKGSAVQWNGTPLTGTTYVSATKLTVTIPKASLSTAGVFPVRVLNPSAQAGPSNAINFNVNNPVPVLRTLSSTSALVGGSAFTLTVTGSGFVNSPNGSVVNWNGSPRATTCVSGTQLQAAILASDLASPGGFPVTVTNPTPGGGTSLPVTFAVNYPVPVLSSLSQTSAIAGSSGFTLTVTGSNFTKGYAVNLGNGSAVLWNGIGLVTTYVSPTQLTAQVAAANIAAAGTAAVSVFNPTPGGGTSAPLTFTIDNPTPMAASLSPAQTWAGSPAFTLTVTGSNFVSTSLVKWNGSPRPTTYLSSTQLTAAIPASDVAKIATAQVTVSSPTPGGGTSAQLPFSIIKPVPPPNPTFSPVGGTYGSGQLVSLMDTGTNVTIYYTTDGTTPTTSSAVYTTPILVQGSEWIKALAAGPSYSPGNVVQAYYKLVGTPAVLSIPATAITATGATLNAIANDLGVAGQVWFVYGTSSTGPLNLNTTPTDLAAKNGNQPVAVPLAGLTTKTTYYAQPVVKTLGGWAYGTILTFTTD